MRGHCLSEVAKGFVPEALKNPVRDVRESLRRLCSSTYYRNSVASSARLNGAVLDGNVLIGADTVLSGDIRIGKYTTLNDECLFSGRIRVGNYCQFGPRVAIYAVNHSVSLLTTYNNMVLLGGVLKTLTQPEPVEIGHDVWIGHGALVMPSVTLGTGCVVGAGSVVTKSVPPYAIAAGCPAVVKRLRFSEPLCALLLKSNWWWLDPHELARFQDLFTAPPENTPVERFEELSKLGAEKAHARSSVSI